MQRLIYGALVVCGARLFHLSAKEVSGWGGSRREVTRSWMRFPAVVHQKLLNLCQTLEPCAELSGWCLRGKHANCGGGIVWRGGLSCQKMPLNQLSLFLSSNGGKIKTTTKLNYYLCVS